MSQLKRRILKAIRSELWYARYLCEQMDRHIQNEEHRLKVARVSSQRRQDTIDHLVGELFILRDEYERLLSAKWVKDAWKLLVPVPPKPIHRDAIDDPSGYWRPIDGSYEWVLSHRGINYVRREVLKVRRENRDRWFPWVALGLPSAIATLALVISIFS